MSVFLITLVLFIRLHSSIAKNDNIYNQADNRWSWGLVDDVTQPNTTDLSKNEDNLVRGVGKNPEECDTYNPPPLNLMGRQLRKSEMACVQYIYNVKTQREKDERDRKCAFIKSTNEGTVAIDAIGGRDAEPGEYPHMGAIGWLTIRDSYVFNCGCSLISSKFVLTAAHCTRASDRDTNIADPVPKIVKFGDRNILRTRFETDISKIIPHPQYKSPKKYYDIALLELKLEVLFDATIQPACLWPNADIRKLGNTATVTGWGVFETEHRTTPLILQASVVDIIDSQQCDSLLRPKCNRLWCVVQEHQLCAGKLSGGVDACQGDSGGPLQVKIDLPAPLDSVPLYYVIGVTSFGIGCAQPNLPGVYSRVSSFIDWIENIVWK